MRYIIAAFSPITLVILGALIAMTSMGPAACSRPGSASPAASSAPDPARDLAPPAPGGDARTDPQATGGMRTAVFAGGCFWCTEAVFEEIDGVSEVVSGYAGGSADSADYRSVSSGSTDHAEVIRITYESAKVSYGQLLKVFFTVAHDPTQLNRQGPDVGRQYRSAVFYQSEEEKQVIEAYVRQLQEAGTFDKPIVTTLEPLDAFYPAEDYHQDYVKHNPAQPYVAFNALPKVEKLRKQFPDLTDGRP